MGILVTTGTVYTPIALQSCDRVCTDFQWLLHRDQLKTYPSLTNYGFQTDKKESMSVYDTTYHSVNGLLSFDSTVLSTIRGLAREPIYTPIAVHSLSRDTASTASHERA